MLEERLMELSRVGDIQATKELLTLLRRKDDKGAIQNLIESLPENNSKRIGQMGYNRILLDETRYMLYQNLVIPEEVEWVGELRYEVRFSWEDFCEVACTYIYTVDKPNAIYNLYGLIVAGPTWWMDRRVEDGSMAGWKFRRFPVASNEMCPTNELRKGLLEIGQRQLPKVLDVTDLGLWRTKLSDIGEKTWDKQHTDRVLHALDVLKDYAGT